MSLVLEQLHNASHDVLDSCEHKLFLEGHFGVGTISPHVVDQTNFLAFDHNFNFGHLQGDPHPVQCLPGAWPIEHSLWKLRPSGACLPLTGEIFSAPNFGVQVTNTILLSANTLKPLGKLHRVELEP